MRAVRHPAMKSLLIHPLKVKATRECKKGTPAKLLTKPNLTMKAREEKLKRS